MQLQFDDTLFTYCNAVDALIEEKYAGHSFTSREETEALRDIAFMEAAFMDDVSVEECAFMAALAWSHSAGQA